MITDVLVWGAGGHCRVTIGLLRQLEQYRVVGILDDNTQLRGCYHAGCPVVGGIECLEEAGFANCAVAIGAAMPRTRRLMWERLRSLGRTPITLVHPDAYVSCDAIIGEASMVAVHAVVNSGARIGKGSLINTSAIVEHDCVVGDFVHVAPGARMAGCVEIGERAFIGIGATIIEFVKVGENATVGAGAIVLKDVAASETVVGNPARSIRKHS